MIAETEPFGSDENGEKEEEEGVVEICVPDHGSTHNRKGEANVEEKDATTGWLCVGPVTAGWEGVGGECVVLVNGKVRSCHGKGRQRGFYCWWKSCMDLRNGPKGLLSKSRNKANNSFSKLF